MEAEKNRIDSTLDLSRTIRFMEISIVFYIHNKEFDSFIKLLVSALLIGKIPLSSASFSVMVMYPGPGSGNPPFR